MNEVTKSSRKRGRHSTLHSISSHCDLAESKAASTNEDINVIWVQCDECKKWRKISKSLEKELKETWYCHENTYDPSHQSCADPEEEWEIPSSKWIYTYNGYIPGQLVWGKLNPYPSWPAIISPDPWCFNTYFSDEKELKGRLFHLEFLGKSRTHAWLPQEMVEPYQGTSSLIDSVRPTRRSKLLQYAIDEADKMSLLSNEERLSKCVYTIAVKEKSRKLRKEKKNFESKTKLTTSAKLSTVKRLKKNTDTEVTNQSLLNLIHLIGATRDVNTQLLVTNSSLNQPIELLAFNSLDNQNRNDSVLKLSSTAIRIVPCLKQIINNSNSQQNMNQTVGAPEEDGLVPDSQDSDINLVEQEAQDTLTDIDIMLNSYENEGFDFGDAENEMSQIEELIDSISH
jgi:hypothetical protein